MCLAGTVVASSSLTQEVAGLSPFTIIRNIFVTELTELIQWKHLGKTRMCHQLINTAQMTNQMLKLIQFLAAVICQQI